MKKRLLAICLLFAISNNNITAQQVTIEGTSTTLNSQLYNPLHTLNASPRSYRSAFIYNESLLTGMINGSVINQLQYNRATNGAALPAGNNLKIWLMNTTANTWGTAALPWDVSGATLVFDGDPAAIVGTTSGYKAFPLATSFNYTGDNLALFSEYAQVNAPSATIPWLYNTNTTQTAYVADQVKYTVNSSTTMPATLNTTTPNHANLKIDYTPPPACTAPPAPGSAIANTSATVCGGSLVKLNLTGFIPSTGQTYKWQSFTTAGGPYTDISTPSANTKLDINPTSTKFYRVAVACSGDTAFSDSVEVKVAALFPGNNYTINSLQPTGGLNFNSFTDAVNAIRCGITGPIVFDVNPSSGPYVEQISIPQITGASAVNTIRFNGNGRQITFNQGNASGQRSAILLDGADYVTIDSLVIDGSAGTYGWGIQLTNTADFNTITNNTINVSTSSTVNANHTGIIIGGNATTPTATGNAGNNNMISGNTITGGYYGIVMTGNTAANAQSVNNKVLNNIVRDFYSHGMNAAYQSLALISNNNISRPTRSTSTTCSGIFLTTGVIESTIEKNRIHDMFTAMPTDASIMYGIHDGADGTLGRENKIVNNVIYNNNFNGIFYGLFNTGADYMHAYHNTIYAVDPATTTGATYGVFITGGTTGVNIRNNIFYISRGGTGIKRVFYFVTITSTIVSNNNLVVFNLGSGGSDNHVGQWGNSLYIRLNDWKTANSNAYDQLSQETDPLFTNVSGGDFTPKEPVIDNLGAAVGVTTDITGASRNASTPDVGAFEFTPPPCSLPITAGNAFSNPSGVVCPNSDVILTLSGNSLGANQTYQWQSSSTLNGTYTDVTAISNYRSSVINPTVNMYYRAAVTCSGTTVYSDTIQVIVASLFPGGTYTINSALPTGGSNFQSFTDAVSAIRCGITGGVTFNVDAASGPYTEQITIPTIFGASPSNPVVFNGNGRTIQFNGISEGRHVIKLDGAKHITFNNLRVAGLNSTYGWGFHLRKASDSNTIMSCTIDMSLVTSNVQNNAVGIAATYATTSSVAEGNNASSNLITSNTIIGGHTGIGLYGISQSSGFYNKKNMITNNTIRDFYATGILIMWNDSATIANNNIHRANRTGTVTTFTGIELRAGCKVALVNANRIHTSHNAGATQNTAAYGIFMNLCDAPAGKENIISNNLIYNMNSLSGLIYGLYNSTSDGVFYYHNTVVIDNTAATAGVTYGFSEQTNLGFAGPSPTAHAHMTLLNNLFFVQRGGSGEKVVLSFLTTPNSITSNRNNLYASTEGGVVNIGKLGSTLYPSLTAWKAVNSGAYDQQSVSIAPGFVTPGSNFAPTTVALNNLGTFVGVTTDFNGTPRSGTTPDIGAIEFSPGIYTFKGTGNWDNPLNWVNELIPPSPLPSGFEVIIDPVSDACILNVPYTVGSGGILTVKAGKNFVVQGNLTQL